MDRLQQGESAIFEVWAVNESGAGVTAASINIKIRRSDAGTYWTGSTWGGATNNAMTETSSTDFPGHYSYTVTAPSADCDMQWFAITASSGVINTPWAETVRIGGWADELDAAVSSRSTLTASSVNTECDTALSDYDAPTKAELDSGLAALNDLSAAEVNAEVVDVLTTDTHAELSALPGATPTLKQMMQFLYQYFRFKKTVTADTETVFKDDGSTSLGTSALSDDGTTFTRDEVS